MPADCRAPFDRLVGAARAACFRASAAAFRSRAPRALRVSTITAPGLPGRQAGEVLGLEDAFLLDLEGGEGVVDLVLRITAGLHPTADLRQIWSASLPVWAAAVARKTHV